MIEENKISAALSKINRDTREAKLVWKTIKLFSNSQLGLAEEIVGKIYSTEFNNRKILLFKVNKKVQTDEFEFNWIPSYKLVVVDQNYNIDWEFPQHRGIADLYETVSYKLADMDSFFNSIQDDDPFR